LSQEAELFLAKLIRVTEELQYARDMHPENTERLQGLRKTQREYVQMLMSQVESDIKAAYKNGQDHAAYACKMVEEGLSWPRI
jgi:hypothetical protein